MARTGNVPIPMIAGGRAKNVNGRPERLVEPAKVLDDRDLGAEQHRVDRSLPGAGVVDVDGVDADHRGAPSTSSSAAACPRNEWLGSP